jgi:hypothetical protein
MNDTIPAPPPLTLSPAEEAKAVFLDSRTTKDELLDAISRALDVSDEDPDPPCQDWSEEAVSEARGRMIERMNDILSVVYNKYGPSLI